MKARILEYVLVRKRVEVMKRKGVAAVEAAIIIPFLVLLTFGGIECGSRLLLAQRASNATRDGARQGARPKTSTPEIVVCTQEAFWGKAYADISQEDLDKVNITITNPTEAGHPVIVTIHCPFENFVPFLPFHRQPVNAQSIFRKEI